MTRTNPVSSQIADLEDEFAKTIAARHKTGQLKRKGAAEEAVHFEKTAQPTVLGGEVRVRIAEPELPGLAAAPEFAAQNIVRSVERTGRQSLEQIDSLTVELGRLRGFLASEGERVQREIARFHDVNKTAVASAATIVEAMSKLTSTIAAPAA